MVGVLGYGKDQTVLPGKCADSAGVGGRAGVLRGAAGDVRRDGGADRVVGPQLPHGGAAAGRQRDGGALRQYDAVYVGDTEEKVIYLTFDAGYEPDTRNRFWTF